MVMVQMATTRRPFWPTVTAILRAQFGHHTMSEQELVQAKDTFLQLTQTSAQRTPWFMLVQYAAKKRA